MSESNRVGLRYIAETVWGTLPATPTMQALRHTDQSLKHDIQSIVSNEIRTDRSTSDLILTDKASSGGFNFELSATTFDDFIEAAMCSTWADKTTTDWAASTAKSLNDVVVPTTDNGYYYRCTTAGTTDTGEPTWPTTFNGTVVDGTVTWTCVGFVECLTNGTTEKSFSFEKAHLDIDEYFLFTGMMVNTMSVDISAGNIVTGGFDFLGKLPTTPLQQTTNANSVTAATTKNVINAIGNIGTVQEGGAAMSGVYIKSASFQINNNLRALTAIGNDSAVDIVLGKMDVSGSIEVYFADDSLYDKFTGNTATSLLLPVNRSGDYFEFYFPNIKYESVDDSGYGSDQDVMHKYNFRALYDTTEDAQMRIGRIQA